MRIICLASFNFLKSKREKKTSFSSSSLEKRKDTSRPYMITLKKKTRIIHSPIRYAAPFHACLRVSFHV